MSHIQGLLDMLFKGKVIKSIVYDKPMDSLTIETTEGQAIDVFCKIEAPHSDLLNRLT